MKSLVTDDLPGVLVPAVSGVKEEAGEADEVYDGPENETDGINVINSLL